MVAWSEYKHRVTLKNTIDNSDITIMLFCLFHKDETFQTFGEE